MPRLVLLSVALCASLLAILANGCSNDLDVTAEEKDIIVVYGILNPQNPQQYVRVARAYLTDGDALRYAAENDLSIRNAIVTLSAPNLPVITLQPLDTVMNDGAFARNYTVFTTNQTVYANLKYTLEVRVPDRPEFYLTAYTTIPDTPAIVEPRDSVLLFGTTWGAPTIELNEDLEVIFDTRRKRNGENVTDPIGGVAFEMRVGVNYSARNPSNNQPERQPTLVYGPIRNIRDGLQYGDCIAQENRVCARLSKGSAISNWLLKFPQGRQLLFDNGVTDPKAPDAFVEISALDTFLYNYLRVNDPAFVDFSSIRPEYTNVVMVRQNGTREQGVGIFGSANYQRKPVALSTCTQAKLGFNGIQLPPNCE